MFRYFQRMGLVSCSLLLFTLVGFSQTNADSILVRGERAESQQQFDQAYKLYEMAGTAYLTEKNYSNYLRSRVMMAEATQFTTQVSRAEVTSILSPIAPLLKDGNIDRYQPDAAAYYTTLGQYHRTITGNYPEALSMFDSALVICDSLGEIAEEQSIKIYVEQSQILANQERFDEALGTAQKGLDLSIKTMGPNSPMLGPRYYNLGFIYYRKGHYDRAEELIKKGIDMIRVNGGPEMQMALGYNNLSAVYVAQMDLREATENAIRFERIIENYLGPGHEAMGMVHWDLGQLKLNLQLFEPAIEDLSKAIDIFNERFGPEYQQLPDLYHQLGAAYDGSEDCEKGEAFHLKGFQLKEKLFGTKSAKVIESHRYLGQHYLDCRDFVNAGAYIVKSFDLAKTFLDPASLSYSWLYDLKGDYLFDQDSFERSAYVQHTALYMLTESQAPLSLLHNPSIDSLFNTLYAAESASAKGVALYRAWESTGNHDYLDAAISTAEFTDQLFDFLRSGYHSSESRTFLQQKARDHYENLINIAYDAYELTGQPLYLEQAWSAMEKSRSLLLMEALKDNQWKGLGLPDSLYSKFRNLQDELAFLEAGILEANEARDSFQMVNRQDAYFQIRDEFLTVTEHIENNYPKYHNLTTQIEPVSLANIQNDLPNDQIFIEFFVGDDFLYKFLLRDSEVLLKRKSITATFIENLEKWIASYQNVEYILAEPTRSISEIDQLSKQLYQFLFDDVTETLESSEGLIIVPDLQLGYLSFDALCTNDQDASEKKYMIFDHNIQYAYSGSHYMRTTGTEDSDSEQIICGVYAPSYSPSPDTLTIEDLYVSRLYRGGDINLPGAHQEGERINKIMGGEVWLGADATETSFKNSVNTYEIIHLALHGIINDEEPLYSKLVFNGDDTINDGYLNTYEVYQLPMSADLVVLSACNTGLGKIEKGEGVMSLSRAFSYAGCPTLVASLWKADDQATSRIMVDFYTNLSKKRSVPASLRTAKINYLIDQKVEAFRHPYFWSAFVSYGQQENPQESFPFRTILIGFLVITAVIIVANWIR